MIAGRELDALVAEKVMGWKHVGLGRSLNPDFIGNPEEGGGLDPVPHYSTDIASAWLVVEKVKFWQPNPEEYALKPDHLQMFTVEYTGFGWRAGWAPINLDGNMTIEAEAETASHAICLAALKAVNAPIRITASIGDGDPSSRIKGEMFELPNLKKRD